MLPGFVAQALVRTLTTHARQDAFFFTVYALMWGIAAYAVYGLLVLGGAWLTDVFDVPVLVIAHWSFRQIVSTESAAALTFAEVAGVTIVGGALGLFGTHAINRTWLHRAARRLGISKQSGGINIWSGLFDDALLGEDNVWVRAYPADSDVWYDGWAQRYSDEDHELFLRDVHIYNRASGEEMARVPAMYLRLASDSTIVLDFPTFEATDQMSRYDPPAVGVAGERIDPAP